MNNGDGGVRGVGGDGGTACVLPAGTCRSAADCFGGAECLPYDGTEACVIDPCWSAAQGASTSEAAAVDPRPPCLGRCAEKACTDNSDCGAHGYCDFGAACGGSGVCRARPVGCGVTYPNDDPVPMDSGARKRAPDGSSDVPARDMAHDDDAGFAEPQLAQVCGCDGQDYLSACHAAAAGVSVAQAGICGSAPGCFDSGECAADSFCMKPMGCTAETGRCVKKPISCPPMAESDWLCGCDGLSYNSDCEAAMAGVNISNEGGCGEPVCMVYSDCCTCAAFSVFDPPPTPCPATCDTSACIDRGFKYPVAYELEGRCWLTDGAPGSCSNDGDCLLVDDCCACEALPAYVEAPVCLADCEVGQCTAFGLVNIAARCVGGSCRLSY